MLMGPRTFSAVRRLFLDFRVRGEEEAQTLPLDETDLIVRKAG
jgi:hypothetical protein